MGRRQVVPNDLERAARAAADGDREAFAALCAAVQTDVWRYCWAILGEADLADEAAQETFARMVTAIGRYRGDVSVKAWVCVIARRACVEQTRQRSMTPTPAETVAPPTDAGPSDTIDALSLLKLLDDDLRHAFVLTQLIGLSYEATAHVTEVPIGTIRARVHRARNILAAAWLERTTPRPTRTVTNEPSPRRPRSHDEP